LLAAAPEAIVAAALVAVPIADEPAEAIRNAPTTVANPQVSNPCAVSRKKTSCVWS